VNAPVKAHSQISHFPSTGTALASAIGAGGYS
jgi:hypothetical protein